MKISLNNAKLITAALVITSLVGSFTMATILSGCIDDTEKLPKVVAGFTFTVNEDTGAVTFFNISERATKYVWKFGDNTTSTEENPIKIYPNGTYEVSLKASNNAGASNEVKASLTVLVKDKVSLPITFDNATVDYAVTTFGGTSFAIVNNPSLSGTNNKTTKVGSITNTGNAFEGMFLNVATQIDLATKKTIAMNIRSTTPVNVLLKLEEGTSGAIETTLAHSGSGWENLLFDFNSSAKYSRITLFFGGATPKAGTFFVDDIEQRTTLAPTAPTTAAPTPPVRASGDVISIYGGTYTNLAGVNYSPNWGQNPPVVVNPSFNPGNGNLALAYTNLNFQGTEFASVDASSMQFLHVDIWVADGTNRQIKVSPINNGAGATGAAEVQVNVPLTPGAWNSIDLPKSSFTGMTWNAIQQMIFNGQFNGDGSANTTSRVDVYLDNIYFYKTAGGGGGGTNLVTNGGFETGNDTGWIFINNNGTVSVSNTENNGGSFSGKIDSNQFGNPGIKQERFGAGTILPNTQYEVKFDIKQQTLIDGGVINAFMFSENNNSNPAVQHPLTPVLLTPGAWRANTFTFTTAADVSGGVSLLIEVVCGGAATCDGIVFIDNVSVIKK